MMSPKLINWISQRVQRSADLINLSQRSGTRQFAVDSRIDKQIRLTDGTSLTEFISCSYLGLEQDERLLEGAKRAMDQFGMQFACARTRVRHRSYDELEDLLRAICNGRPCVTFNSVTLTHLAILPLLAAGELPSFGFAGTGPAFILDKHVHASVQINRALLSQFGPVYMADVRDLETLAKTIDQNNLRARKVFILIDGIGSMEGSVLNVDLINFCREHSICLYVDDAHGTSILGRHGSGSVLNLMDAQNFTDYLVSGSLSKAFGCGGGYVAFPSEADAQHAKEHSPVYTFSGPLQIPVVGAAIASADIHLSDEIYALQRRLWANVERFDQSFEGSSINKGTFSPLRGVYGSTDAHTNDLAIKLRAAGFATTLALFPTVKKGNGRIRLAFSARHTEAQIDSLANTLNELILKAGPHEI